MVGSATSLRELEALARSEGPAARRRVAKEFEALIVGEMLRFGSKPIAGSHVLDGGSAGRMAREQLYAELAQIASQGQGLGLADQLEAEMSEESAASADRGEGA